MLTTGPRATAGDPGTRNRRTTGARRAPATRAGRAASRRGRVRCRAPRSEVLFEDLTRPGAAVGEADREGLGRGEALPLVPPHERPVVAPVAVDAQQRQAAADGQGAGVVEQGAAQAVAAVVAGGDEQVDVQLGDRGLWNV